MSKSLPTTLDAFSKYAAEQFIQTAVFIDDKIYRKIGAIAEPRTLLKPVPERKLALKSAKTTAPAKTSIAGDSDEAEEYSPHDVLTSFAKKRIVCSLYQPKRGSSVGYNSDAYQLCIASDIVIVDWDLYGDAGAKAKELIGNLIEQSLKDIPEQLRLVFVYTKEANLQAIANEVYGVLNGVVPDNVEPQVEDNGLALLTPNTRVVILGKPGRRLEEYATYQVEEKGLADRAIIEFAKLAAGLLQGAIILGLARIRSNSRKILSKFDSSLDPAFLTHRALLLPDDEDLDHVLPLLAAEIQAVLEDCLPSPLISKELINDWCDNRWKPGPHAKPFVGEKINVVDFAKDFCVTGAEIKNKYPSLKLKNLISKKDGSWLINDKDNYKKLVAFLQPGIDSKENQKLALLMSNRTHYSKTTRELSLGTIVRVDVESKREYLICLQPVCDSVRLDKVRRFIFCALQSRDAISGLEQMSHIIEDKADLVGLRFKPKIFDCMMIEFEPDTMTQKVIAKQNAEQEFCFTSKAEENYIWIAQLKTEHAQRAVEQFARDLSRVGLTESEWLRLLAK